MACMLTACDPSDPVVTAPVADPDGITAEGLWAGMDESGVERRLACLKMVEPDSAAAFELVEVDTEAGRGLIAAAEGKWSYRPPLIDIELFGWPDARGIPRMSAELGSTGKVLLLRVSYRQGDQFTVGMERASRCGRFVG